MLDHQDLNAVQAAAQRAVDQTRYRGAAVRQLERWGGGAHNSGFQLHLEDGTRLFLKIEKERIFPRSRRCQVEREVYGIRLAQQAGLDVPEVVGYDFTGHAAGCRYVLEEFVDRDLLGEALERLPEAERAPLLEALEQKGSRLFGIHGMVFGELHPGGWLGQFDSWREMMVAFSAVLLEDAAELGYYSAAELRDVSEAHDIALDAILHEGPAILTHNDLHVWNAFVEQSNGALQVGKLFDFGLSLFQAEYLACFGQYAFGGKEAEVANRFGVSVHELHGYRLVSGAEFVNFLWAIRFAPDRPHGCLARSKAYLEQCRAFLR